MSDKVDLTKEQKQELEKLLIPIVEESISVKLDYEQNPSNLYSGSIVVVHQDSTLLDNKEEELSDIAYNITRKSSSINVWGDDDWATPQEEEKKKQKFLQIKSSRHSRFGGSFTVMNVKSISERPLIYHKPLSTANNINFDENKRPKKISKNRKKNKFRRKWQGYQY